MSFFLNFFIKNIFIFVYFHFFLYFECFSLPNCSVVYIFHLTVFDHFFIFPSLSFSSFSVLEKHVYVIFSALFFKKYLFLSLFISLSPIVLFYVVVFIYSHRFVPFFPTIRFLSLPFLHVFRCLKNVFMLFFTLYFLKIFIFFPLVSLFIYFVFLHCCLYIIYIHCTHFFSCFDFYAPSVLHVFRYIKNHFLLFFILYFLKIFIFIPLYFLFPHFIILHCRFYVFYVSCTHFRTPFSFLSPSIFHLFAVNQKPFFVIFHVLIF